MILRIVLLQRKAVWFEISREGNQRFTSTLVVARQRDNTANESRKDYMEREEGILQINIGSICNTYEDVYRFQKHISELLNNKEIKERLGDVKIRVINKILWDETKYIEQNVINKIKEALTIKNNITNKRTKLLKELLEGINYDEKLYRKYEEYINFDKVIKISRTSNFGRAEWKITVEKE